MPKSTFPILFMDTKWKGSFVTMRIARKFQATTKDSDLKIQKRKKEKGKGKYVKSVHIEKRKNWEPSLWGRWEDSPQILNDYFTIFFSIIWTLCRFTKVRPSFRRHVVFWLYGDMGICTVWRADTESMMVSPSISWSFGDAREQRSQATVQRPVPGAQCHDVCKVWVLLGSSWHLFVHVEGSLVHDIYVFLS